MPKFSFALSYLFVLAVAATVVSTHGAGASDTDFDVDRFLITDEFRDGRLIQQGGHLLAPLDPSRVKAKTAAQGKRSLLVLLANFTDTPQPTLTPAQVDELVFTQAADFYHESSYGRMTLTGEVRGWYDIPSSSTNCNIFNVAQLAIAAADADVDFSVVQHLLVLAPFTGCSFAGRAYTVPLRFTTDEGWVSMGLAAVHAELATLLFVAHELGHQFNLGHSDFLDCGWQSIKPGCFVARYKDRYSVMGYGNSWFLPRHPNAIHKEYLGWLDHRSIQTATRGGSYVIAPIERADPDITKALKIPRRGGEFLYIEYRQPIGWDVGMDSMPFPGGDEPTTVFEGALFHIPHPEIGLGTYLLDASVGGDFGTTDYATATLPVGYSFTDSDTGSEISVLSQGPDYIEVYVALSYDCSDPRTIVPPDTPEICGNHKDDNCDGFIDEGCLCGDYRCPDFAEATPGIVDGADLTAFVSAFGSSWDRHGTSYDPAFDLTCDGYVDGSDLAAFAARLGASCEPEPTSPCCIER